MTTVGVLEKRRQERKFIWLLINVERFNLRRPHKQVTRQAGGPPPRIATSSSLGGRWRKGGSGVEKKSCRLALIGCNNLMCLPFFFSFQINLLLLCMNCVAHPIIGHIQRAPPSLPNIQTYSTYSITPNKKFCRQSDYTCA